MMTFRGVIIFGGLIILGILWGAQAWFQKDFPNLSPSIELWRYIVVFALSFLIVVRVWDAYYQHHGDNDG